MAVTLTVEELTTALRLGDTPEETTEATRLLAYATEAVSRHLAAAYDDTPDVVLNEAAIRIAGYLFDQPTAARGDTYANAMRSSGAGAILAAYRVHRAGKVDVTVSALDEEVS